VMQDEKKDKAEAERAESPPDSGVILTPPTTTPTP